MYPLSLDFQTLLDNLDLGIWCVDQKGHFIFENSFFLKTTGYSREWYAARDVYQLVEEGYTDHCVSDYVLQTKQKHTVLQKVVPGNGIPGYNQIVSAIPTFDDRGNILFIIGVVQSVDHFNRRYQDAVINDIQGQVFLNQNRQQDYAVRMIAHSPEMKALLDTAKEVSEVDSSILITGESGVGKNALASYIHRCSPRRGRELVEINCAALPEHLLEAELFGFEKGAFTGALDSGKRGIFEEAHGGTLFLDEINSLPLNLQGKLLRVIETGKMRRVGSNRDIYVDFRLITATNTDLQQQIGEQRFRADLYYRLNVIPLEVPALRSRKADIIPLCLHFLKQYCQKYDRVKVLSDRVFEQMLSYDWPGNVRELRNCVERIVVTSSRTVMEIRELPSSFFGQFGSTFSMEPSGSADLPILIQPNELIPDMEEESFSLQSYLEQCEKSILEKILKKYKSTYKAAEILKISQPSVVRRKSKYHIDY